MTTSTTTFTRLQHSTQYLRWSNLRWSNLWVVVIGTMLLMSNRATSFQHATTPTMTRLLKSKHTLKAKVTTLPDTKSTATTITTKDTPSPSPSSSTTSPIEGLWRSIQSTWMFRTPITNNRRTTPTSPGTAFFQAVANRDIDQAMTYFDDRVEWADTAYPSPLNRQQLERQLRLQAQQLSKLPKQCPNAATPIMIENEIFDPENGKAGVIFRQYNNQRCAAFFQLTKDGSLIQEAFVVQEHQKQGAIKLQILKIASDIIGLVSSTSSSSSTKSTTTTTSSNNKNNNGLSKSPTLSTLSLPEQYSAAWNQRDMNRATSLFATTVEYDDTAFPKPFQGKDALAKHLSLCTEVLPSGFTFCLDDKIDVGDQVMVRWHVENEGQELPFTKGCSFYEIENDKIIKGTDWIEPAVFKTGNLNLFFTHFVSSLKDEPVRLIPLAVWITYCYVVFFSNWFFGVPVQALEARTWEEVRDLSLNFFLISPILGLPFAPIVHPGLEGIFNLLLSWAALFAGFLSDDRPKKPNPLPMLPTVLGMQFLTSAFLLPYLATRSTETESNITTEDLTVISRVTESRWLGPAMGMVGTGSILWGLFARSTEFGGLQQRWSSLLDLLSIDRVGSSFLVDLLIFSLFQGWLVDDDQKRRGVMDDNPHSVRLYQVAKYVPFFGMVAYLTFRPSFPSNHRS